jgi:hypothetical protein
MTIGILSTTAVMLLVGVMIIHSRPRPAVASGVTAAGGDYVMMVGTGSIDEELLFVIKNSEQKMISYRYESGVRRLEVNQRVDLKQLREATAEPPQPTGKTPRKGRRRP